MTFNANPGNDGYQSNQNPHGQKQTGSGLPGPNANQNHQGYGNSAGMNHNQYGQNSGFSANPASHQFEGNPTPARNTLAIVALAMAVIGFIFACIPGALIVGWFLLPIAFILGIVSLFMKGKKGFGIAAIIVSVVGTIVGMIAFATVAVDAVDDAFGGGDTSVERPNGESSESGSDDASNAGSREEPLPIGSKISTKDWAVTVNSVTLNANDQVANENTFNDPPEPGMQYMLVNVTADYLGNDPQGATPWVSVKYLKSDGTTLDSSDSLAVAPESFENLETVYEGASVTGNFAIQVPSDSVTDGVLAVDTDILSDTAFVAVQ